MKIRGATRKDATAIARLAAGLGLGLPTWDFPKQLARILAGANDRVKVAVDGRRVVGWIHGHASIAVQSGPRVEIIGLIVASDWRRRGIARELVEEIERWANQLGIDTVVVRSNVQREESRRFYPAVGYGVVKTQEVFRKRLVLEADGPRAKVMPAGRDRAGANSRRPA